LGERRSAKSPTSAKQGTKDVDGALALVISLWETTHNHSYFTILLNECRCPSVLTCNLQIVSDPGRS
jgi:hypothetical protein